jgi:hypothetical protein
LTAQHTNINPTVIRDEEYRRCVSQRSVWPSSPTAYKIYADELRDVLDRILTLSTGFLALLATFATRRSGSPIVAGVAFGAFVLAILACLSFRGAVATFGIFTLEPGQVAAEAAPLERLDAELENLEAKRTAFRPGSAPMRVTQWALGSLLLGVMMFLVALGASAVFAVDALTG